VHTHEVLYTLIRMSKMGERTPDAERLLQIVRDLEEQSSHLPVAERCQVLFSLGKAHEDREEYAEAVKVFSRANALKRANTEFDIDKAESKLARIAQGFDAE